MEKSDMTIVLAASRVARSEVSVASFAEASAVWNKFREDNTLRSSEMSRGAGNVKKGGRKVATVSFNGRVWDLKGVEITE